ncbi:MAG: DUF4255 domain-containing protein [Phycisphaerales bacterium]|nr:DUF4255 domain-containing protein [Phycisphaerales bacterium]
MTGTARASIAIISTALVDLLRSGLERDGLDGVVALGASASSARKPARARLEVVLHRINPDPAMRQAPPGRDGPVERALALRLGYVVLARGPGPAAEQRAITAALRALTDEPELIAGRSGPWRVGVETVTDELRLAFFSAMRLPVCPSAWCDITGVID